MEGRLSNSALLRQIIPKVNNSSGQKEPIQKCSTRKVSSIELVSTLKETKQESLITKELLEKLNKIKESSEYANILKGSRLGLSAYQKPSSGIPLSDLSKDLKTLLEKAEKLIKDNSVKQRDFGQVTFNEITRKINFYAADDTNRTKVLGSLDVTKFSPNLIVDKTLNLYSTRAIANSVVTENLEQLKDRIPNINVYDETLNIRKNE